MMKQILALCTLALAARTAVCDSSPAKARILEGHTGSVLAVVFSPDGKTLATGSRDGTIR